MALRGWTSAVRQAWGWVKSGITRALGREEAGEQYVAGGGEIEEREWEDAWTLGEQAYAQGRAIEDIPGEAMILREYFTLVDIDYAGAYHLTAEMEYFDKATGSWETKYVSTNLDTLATKQDWENALTQAVMDTEVSPNVDWDQGVSFYNYIAEERM